MYLLRFSDRFYRMKNSYGRFFIQSLSQNDFPTREKSVSSNQRSAVKMNRRLHVVVGACSMFVESPHFYPHFSRKLALNQRQKSFKEANMPWALSTAKNFAKQGNVWKLEANDFKKARQGKQIKRSWSVDWWWDKHSVRYLRTRFCIRKLTGSAPRSLVRPMIRQQLVRKYRTRALSMK